MTWWMWLVPAWLLVAALGAAVVGKAIRMADARELGHLDEVRRWERERPPHSA